MVAQPILALDIATVMGWAEGIPGQTPTSGIVRFAAPGASHEAIGWEALRWATARFQLTRYRLVLIEAPLPPSFVRGRTNTSTTSLLLGLPLVIGLVAHGLGQFNFKRAKVEDIRGYFLGKRNLRGEEAKRAVFDRCKMLRWLEPDLRPTPVNMNRGDALATWAYGCAAVEPLTKLPLGPLEL